MVEWDLLNEPWNELGTWQKTGAGISTIVDGKLRNNGSGRRKDIGTLPPQYTIETSLMIDEFGTNKFYSYMFYDGEHYVAISVYEDKIACICNGDDQEIVLATTEDVYYVWRFVVDSENDSIKVFRNNVYIGEFTDIFDVIHSDGVIETRSFDAVGYEDYFKIATELHVLPKPPAKFVNPIIQKRNLEQIALNSRPLITTSIQTRNLNKTVFKLRKLTLTSFIKRKMIGVWSIN